MSFLTTRSPDLDSSHDSIPRSGLVSTIPWLWSLIAPSFVVLCKKLRMAGDFNFQQLARATPGYVGADLCALTKEAAVISINRIFKELYKKEDDLVKQEEVGERVSSNVSEDAEDMEIVDATGEKISASGPYCNIPSESVTATDDNSNAKNADGERELIRSEADGRDAASDETGERRERERLKRLGKEKGELSDRRGVSDRLRLLKEPIPQSKVKHWIERIYPASLLSKSLFFSLKLVYFASLQLQRIILFTTLAGQKMPYCY